MLIKGNFICAPSLGTLTIKENQYAYVKDGLLQKFYNEVPPELTGEKITDYSSSIIIPAFIDLHIHAPQYLNRGIGFDKELLPWLETYTFPMEAKFADIAFAQKVYAMFIKRLWACGTLRFSAFASLHAESTWALMQLCEKSGLKAYIGKVNMDRNSPSYLVQDTKDSLFETEDLIHRCQALHNVRYIMTPRFVPSTTPKLMDALGQLCEKYDLPIQSHLSENQNEVKWVKELHPDLKSYTDVYEHFGLLRQNRTIMAHCIYLSDEEKDTLRDKGVFLAHCAQSNANLTSGIMPLRRNLERGQNCSIASDVAAGHTPLMNRQMAISIEVSKLNQLYHSGQKALTLSEALYLATKKPGEFFGKTGSFEPGYEFDALVIKSSEIDDVLGRTPFEKLEQFIYDGDDRDIIARYCAGRFIAEPAF